MYVIKLFEIEERDPMEEARSFTLAWKEDKSIWYYGSLVVLSNMDKDLAPDGISFHVSQLQVFAFQDLESHAYASGATRDWHAGGSLGKRCSEMEAQEASRP